MTSNHSNAQLFVETGCYHHSVLMEGRSKPPIILMVGDNNVEIKENSGASTIVVFEKAE